MQSSPKYSCLGMPSLTDAPLGYERSIMIRRSVEDDLGQVMRGETMVQVKGGARNGPINASWLSSVVMYLATASG